ncbi:MAG: pirin family protein [Proteobacteria bacterium]|nr:pirin family protein [Pseudomonadota bacterium]MBU1687905.1 pirin family protein [Pseudomonadota bacterium]
MTTTRTIKKIMTSRPVIEGAGVHLNRAFGFSEERFFDPFLLLDDFRSSEPAHYLKGFPWHPHRGIETITYVLAGDVEHGDSMGNKGIISSGDVQWMTAGSGIVHQEMPQGDALGRMEGFQLWANLPASEKMMAPRYRDVKAATIPEVVLENNVRIRIICGRIGTVEGPVKDIVIDPEYLDITVPPNTTHNHPTPGGHTVLAYVIGGQGSFGADQGKDGIQTGEMVNNRSLLLFADGDQVTVTTSKDPVRFLLVSGRPIGEPIAWSGPIVMNTQEELQLAFKEYENGTFIK